MTRSASEQCIYLKKTFHASKHHILVTFTVQYNFGWRQIVGTVRIGVFLEIVEQLQRHQLKH